MRLGFGIFFLGFFLLGVLGHVFAVDVPSPQSSEAGTIGKKIQKEKELPTADSRTLPPSAPKESLPSQVPDQGPKFVVMDIKLEGNTILPESVFEPILKPYKRRELTFRDLETAAAAVKQEYRRRGYVTTFIYIPEQKLKDGIVIFSVVEGRMGDLKTEGNYYFSKSLIESYWQIPKKEILQYDAMFESLVRMNENPDRQVQSVLMPGVTPGTSDVILKVKDQAPYHGGVQLDNYGTYPAGKYRLGVTLRDTNLTGYDDTLQAGTVLANHLNAEFGQYLVPLNRQGTRLLLGFSEVQVSPKGTLESFYIHGRSQSYNMEVLQALPVWDLWKSTARGGFDWKESRTKVIGTTLEDRLSVFHLGLDAQRGDGNGSWSITQTLSTGVPRLLYSTRPSSLSAGRLGTGSTFIKYALGAARRQRLPWETQGLVNFQGQAASHALPSSEQFYLGGATSIRGYPEGDYLADQALMVNLEWQIPSYVFHKDFQLPWSSEPLQNQIQVVAFFDEGWGDRLQTAPGSAESRNMMGTGAGLRIHLYDHVFLRGEWGYAMGEAPTTSGRSRAHFRVETDF